MSLLDYWQRVRTRLWVFVLSAILGLGAGGLVVLVSTKQYTARSLVFFASPPGRAAQDLSPGLIFAQGLVRSYAQALTQPLVLDPALQKVRRRYGAGLGPTPYVETVVPLNTTVIEVRATAADPGAAATLADTVVDQLVSDLPRLAPSASSADYRVAVSAVTRATVPLEPSSPRVRLDLVVGLAGGVLVGLVACLALDARNPLLGRGRRDAVAGVAVVGSIVRRGGMRRRLRTGAVDGLALGPPVLGCLLVTAPDGRAGSTAVADRLGRVLHRRGLSVVVVDVDLTSEPRTTVVDAVRDVVPRPDGPGVDLATAVDTRPRVARSGGVAGLTDVLKGDRSWREVLLRDHSGLELIPAGAPVPEGGAVLGSPAMYELLGELRANVDVVVLAGGPVLQQDGLLMLAPLVDAVLLVTDGPRMRLHRFEDAVAALELVGAPPRGAVLA